ncbi:transglycosylase domain-containing protein [Desulfogranum marinum]|uniref:transglycosylase domain-containing protein n=1 Tax=Desulfogranum marinum TaxID=453220 RepID=UPI0029C65642|nr:transglycosylase domain-containing protein [Desulfogranum marinum]
MKYLFFSLCILGLLLAGGVAGGLYYLVVVNPGPEVEEEYIEEILGRESPVFFRDGEQKLGVLFQDVHRQYLAYHAIPQHFINAIVAAEDDEFFSHFGVDIPGIVRAMIANIKAGRVVQGGSTITQQTAKNLFKRKSRSYQAKLKELLFALRLEYKYSKEKILEFYSNQFFVSGNGHGLGVAARYYFNKEPYALNLLECAYIAGSVKRPNYYNPFTKRNQADPVKARQKVDERVRYVLQKMLAAQKITKQEYEQAIHSDVAFERGKMAFRLNTTMDMVKDGLSTAIIKEALEDHGVSNVSTSGVRVITTIDKQIQEQTLYALRRQLSLLDVRLRGYNREEVQQEYRELEYAGDTELLPGAFAFGVIDEVRENKSTGFYAGIDIGEGKATVVLDEAGLKRMIAALAKFNKNRWSEPDNKDRRKLIKQLQPGDVVYVSIRPSEGEGPLRGDLERYPKVEGGVMALQQGAVRAMAGGMTDRYFNRAIDAKRLMGSTFKPFLFAAALQLGWSPVDMLSNQRDVFVFMNRPYFPRPDHNSPHDVVSMSWAGVESENLAAVWLLYHLTDHLSPLHLREVAKQVEMAPMANDGVVENYQHFKQRIRDDFGIVVNGNVLKEAAFDKARKNLRADFLFDNRFDEYKLVEQLDYGLYYDRFREQIKELLQDKSLSSYTRKDLHLQRGLLDDTYLSLAGTIDQLNVYRRYVEAEARQGANWFGGTLAGDFQMPSGFLVQDQNGGVHYTSGHRDLKDRQWTRWPIEQVISFLQTLNASQLDIFWEGVHLEGSVTVGSYKQLQEQITIEENTLFALRPYSLEVLTEVRDYRIMLGLQYLVRLGYACGIESKLEPVLSFPLGSNVVSLLEITRMYEALVTGNNFVVAGQNGERISDEDSTADRNGLAIIERIEAPDGEVIYQQTVNAQRVFDQATVAAVGNILENTVLHGTGKYAHKTVRLHSNNPDREQELADFNLPVPLLGKTGTANRYRNASFLGHVPVLGESNESFMSVDNGYTVGVYVGYDNNAPMIKGTTRITGGQGALPVWSKVAETLLQSENVGERLDVVDLAFNGLVLQYPDVGQLFLPVEPDKGGRLKKGGGGKQQTTPPSFPCSLGFGHFLQNEHFEPVRNFHPFWDYKSDDRKQQLESN